MSEFALSGFRLDDPVNGTLSKLCQNQADIVALTHGQPIPPVCDTHPARPEMLVYVTLSFWSNGWQEGGGGAVHLMARDMSQDPTGPRAVHYVGPDEVLCVTVDNAHKTLARDLTGVCASVQLFLCDGDYRLPIARGCAVMCPVDDDHQEMSGPTVWYDRGGVADKGKWTVSMHMRAPDYVYDGDGLFPFQRKSISLGTLTFTVASEQRSQWAPDYAKHNLWTSLLSVAPAIQEHQRHILQAYYESYEKNKNNYQKRAPVMDDVSQLDFYRWALRQARLRITPQVADGLLCSCKKFDDVVQKVLLCALSVPYREDAAISRDGKFVPSDAFTNLISQFVLNDHCRKMRNKVRAREGCVCLTV